MAVALCAASGRSPAGVVAAGSAVLSGQLAVGWHNDWRDAERDTRSGRPDKPVARGQVSRPAVGWAAACAGTATLPLSLLSGWRAGLAHIVAVALALGYNAWLKGTPVSFLPYLLAFPLLVAFISWGRHPSQWPPWWALAGAALLGTGAHLANAAPDIGDDLADGLRGLPQRLGQRRSVGSALALLVGSTAVLGLGLGAQRGRSAGPEETAALAFAALLVGVAIGSWWLGRDELRPRRWAAAGGPRVWFRVVMLAALADVALLVLGGASL
jgi:4-hydroxybenzoate polyprenyltransferase